MSTQDSLRLDAYQMCGATSSDRDGYCHVALSYSRAESHNVNFPSFMTYVSVGQKVMEECSPSHVSKT